MRALVDNGSIEIDPVAAQHLALPGAKTLIRQLAERLEATEEFTEESVERQIRRLAAERGVKTGLIIQAARAVLTGQSVGPSAFAVFRIIGRERSIRRLRGG